MPRNGAAVWTLLLIGFVAPCTALEPETSAGGASDQAASAGGGPVGSLSAPAPATGEWDAPPPESTVFTVEQLEMLAQQNNPTLRQLSASIAKSRGLRLQVGLYPNPAIGYSGNEIGADAAAGQQGAFVSQTIVTGNKLELNRRVAEWETQSLLWELESQRQRVSNAVRAQFYRTMGAERRVAIAKRLLAVAQTGVTTTEVLLKAGEGTRPDVLQARIQLNEVGVALRNAEAEYEASWTQLIAMVGCPALPAASLAGDLATAPLNFDQTTLYAQLVAASPELRAARARVARARAQIQRQEAQPVPNLEVQAGVAHDFSSDNAIANVQLAAAVPLFNRNQGNIQIARAELHRAAADVRRRELDLQARAAAAIRDYRQAANQVVTYRNEILPAAQENLELTEIGYERGEFDLLRALTARRSFFEANLALVTSEVALREAEIAVDGLLLTDGGLIEVPDSEVGSLVDLGLRDQAISGE